MLSNSSKHLAIFEKNLIEHEEIVESMSGLLPILQTMTEECVLRLKRGGKIFICGNGGSAAEAQHLTAELVGRFNLKNRPAIPAIALTTDSSILTALSNDFDYKIIFSRQLEALCQSEDVVLLLSTSGCSANILLAAEMGRAKSAYTVGWTGETGGTLKNLVDICLQVPSCKTARVQEMHVLLGHMWCQAIEQILY